MHIPELVVVYRLASVSTPIAEAAEELRRPSTAGLGGSFEPAHEIVKSVKNGEVRAVATVAGLM